MTRSEYFQTCSSADSGVAKTTVFLVALLRLAMLFHREEGKPVADRNAAGQIERVRLRAFDHAQTLAPTIEHRRNMPLRYFRRKSA
ncbi:hypothetical protein AWV80_36385 [Cupriavidus sp. UYMU48A]|nr:hypothetical protein AWV80_36385 [Cupriavidus sp. UYMU48A]